MTEEKNILDQFLQWIEKPENEKFKNWHNLLIDSKFALKIAHYSDFKVESNRNTLLEQITYRWDGEFSVRGDHACDGFMISACLSNDGVIFYYCSSYIDEVYMSGDGLGLTIKEQKIYLDDMRNFINNNSTYIGNKNIKIEYHLPWTYFWLCKDEAFGNYFWVKDCFTKLAILLDIQTTRKFPFLNIQGYEMIYRQESDADFFAQRAHENIHVDVFDVLTHLIGSSYSQELDDVLRRVEKLLTAFSENSVKNKKAINLLTEAHQQLSVMSPDEFGNLREDVFDL